MKGASEDLYSMVFVKPVELGSVRAYFGIETRDGLTLRSFTLHHSPDGHRRIGYPSEPKLTPDGRVVRNEQGKIHWYATAYIADNATREDFEAWAFRELDQILPALRRAGKRAPEFRGVGGAR